MKFNLILSSIFVFLSFTNYASSFESESISNPFTCILNDSIICSENCITIEMYDSGGDGWNGTSYIVVDDNGYIVTSGTLELGSYGSQQFCLENGCYGINVFGGSFNAEISWSLSSQEGTIFSNQGATTLYEYREFSMNSFCEVGGCMNPAALNYNPWATINDNCTYLPSNDLCSNAMTMVCEDSMYGSTTNATNDEEAMLSSCGSEIEGPGVWYHIIGTGGMMIIETCNSIGTNYDTKLSLFGGSCENLICLTCDDNGCSGNLSSIPWATELGVDYYILVHGANGSTGSFQLNVTCPDCSTNIPNDDCSGAIQMDSNVSINSDLCCVKQDIVETCANGCSSAYGLWYYINSGTSLTVDYSLENLSGENVGLHIFEDTNNTGCNNLTMVDCGITTSGVYSGTISSFINLQENTDYYFLVYTDAPVLCGSFEFTTTATSSGCLDTAACNYNPILIIDDGSCEYTSCIGCTDSMACNYEPIYTQDDGSCEYTCYGCMDMLACNYNFIAIIDDDSCEYISCLGCTISFFCNYDPNALILDGSCIPTGCMDSTACNYDSTAGCDSGNCMYSGCIVPGDLNGDGTVNAADLLIILADFGCIGDCTNDMNGDGMVNSADLLELLTWFGYPQ